MAQDILFNGAVYTIPDTGEEDWGLNLTNYFVAIPQGALQKSGGSFILTADANFGSNFGLVALYLKSVTANISTAGVIRLARTDSIGWRNAANGANLLLSVDGSNNLTFNGASLVISGLIVNADISASAAIARSKLASGTNYRILANDSLGVMSENAALTSTHVVIVDANGQLVGEATLAKSRGGMAQDNSSLTFPSTGTVQATTPNNHGVIVSGAGATATVIAPNASTAFPLVSGGSSADPAWAKLTEAGGGTNQSTYSTGDILYASGSNTLSKLPATTDGYVLTLASGVPTWASAEGLPAGVVLPYGGTSAPTGFLLCDGSTVSRSTYATLYAAVGNAFGNGNGTTTFHIPDLRGRFVRGLDGAAGRDPDSASRTAMNSGGNTANNVGSVQADQYKAHTHAFAIDEYVTTATGPNLAAGHGVVDNTYNGTTASSGGNETRPLNAYLNYIIKF